VHLLVLLILAIPLVAAESSPAPILSGPLTLAVAAGGPVLILLGAWGLLRLARPASRRPPATPGWSSWRAIGRSERRLRRLQWAVLIPHAVACFGGGLPWRVRELVGDWIILDELLVMLPPLLALVGVWMIWAPVEIALRDAGMIDRFERGLALGDRQTRRGVVGAQIRAQILLVLLPAILALGLIEIARDALADVEPTWILDAAQFAAVALVLVISPWLARVVLDATPMPEGPLRDMLLEVAHRYGVRIGSVLVWRTGMTQHNGAVVGVLPGARCVLLTDALLEDLPERELVAVMAHEVAHLRCRHMLIALAALLTTSTLLSLVLSLLLGQLLEPSSALAAGLTEQARSALVDGGALIGAVVGVLVIFGWVSRRLERQADAFAVRHLSSGLCAEGAAEHLTSSAAQTMCDALDSVARPSGIDPRQHSWRHGSIVWRQSYLRALAGLPLGPLAIDRQVRWIAGASVAGMILAAALGAVL